MATVKLNNRHPLNCSSIPGINQVLLSGVNIGVPDEAVEAIKSHPYLLTLLEDGIIEITRREPKAQGSLLGIPVVENKVTGEADPIITPQARETASGKSRKKAYEAPSEKELKQQKPISEA